MKKAIKYVFYSLATAYFPCLFLLPLIIHSDGTFVIIPYEFELFITFIITFPLYLAYIELGLSVGRAFSGRARSVGERIINTVSTVLAATILIACIDIEKTIVLSCVFAGLLVVSWVVGAIAYRKERRLPETLKKRSFWICAVAISLVLCLGIVAVNAISERGNKVEEFKSVDDLTFTVTEVHDSYLLVKPASNSSVSKSSDLFSVPNYFEGSVKKGDTVIIKHDGLIQETYPARFNKIHEMTHIKGDGINETVIID